MQRAERNADFVARQVASPPSKRFVRAERRNPFKICRSRIKVFFNHGPEFTIELSRRKSPGQSPLMTSISGFMLRTTFARISHQSAIPVSNRRVLVNRRSWVGLSGRRAWRGSTTSEVIDGQTAQVMVKLLRRNDAMRSNKASSAEDVWCHAGGNKLVMFQFHAYFLADASHGSSTGVPRN